MCGIQIPVLSKYNWRYVNDVFLLRNEEQFTQKMISTSERVTSRWPRNGNWQYLTGPFFQARFGRPITLAIEQGALTRPDGKLGTSGDTLIGVLIY